MASPDTLTVDLTKLQIRDLTEEEIAKVTGVSKRGSEKAKFLIEALRPLEIGQGREIGPFGTANQAKTFRSSYLSTAADVLGWPKRNGKDEAIRRTKADVEERDGGAYLRIVRLA